MKNLTVPRQLRDGYLKGIGYQPEVKPSPVYFFLGLVIGVCVGVML